MRLIYSLLCAVSLGFFAWTATGAEKAARAVDRFLDKAGPKVEVKEVAHAAEAEKGLPPSALRLGSDGTSFLTNSMFLTWIVALALILFAQFATKNLTRGAPSGAQNFWEWLVESLYEFLESIIGHDLVKKSFWFFATLFIFILASNWFGLIPGVGTIGWGVADASGHLEHITKPVFRGVNADLNMTFAMAMIFFVCWTLWALQS